MDNLAELRIAAGLTQNQLAAAMGVDRTAISKWETGEALPRTDKLKSLAKALNCSIDELLKGVEQ